MSTRTTLMEIYERLMGAYGPQHWWPGETPLEVMVGAVLTQNTNWANVEKAIANLKREGLLSAEAIHAMDAEALGEVVRPAGYYRVKAVRLKNLMRMLVEEYGGETERMFATGTRALRERLLGVNGIGKETADSILLYAGNKASFVVDTYTYRVLRRHRMIDMEADYERIREVFEESLDENVQLYNEFHALLVKVGKEHCKPRARCAGCPLEAMAHEVEEEEMI